MNIYPFLLEEVIIFGGGRFFIGGSVFCWMRCIFLEEVFFIGGGVFFWRKCFLLEEVYFFGGSVFFVGGGDVCFWSRVALTGHRNILTNDIKITQEVISEQNNLGTECSETDDRGPPSIEQVASVQTRAMVEREKRPVKPLKVATISGLNIGPEELKEKQRSDTTLKKYWDMVSVQNSHYLMCHYNYLWTYQCRLVKKIVYICEVSRVRVMLLMSVAYNFFCLLLGLLFCCLSLYR